MFIARAKICTLEIHNLRWSVLELIVKIQSGVASVVKCQYLVDGEREKIEFDF